MKQLTLNDGRVKCPECGDYRYPEDCTEFDTEKYPKYRKYKNIKLCVGCAEIIENRIESQKEV